MMSYMKLANVVANSVHDIQKEDRHAHRYTIIGLTVEAPSSIPQKSIYMCWTFRIIFIIGTSIVKECLLS